MEGRQSFVNNRLKPGIEEIDSDSACNRDGFFDLSTLFMLLSPAPGSLPATDSAFLPWIERSFSMVFAKDFALITESKWSSIVLC